MTADGFDNIVKALARHRFTYTNEDELQQALTACLEGEGYDVEREVRLSAGDRIDLMAGTVGIEVKVAGRASAVLAQLQRYAKHDKVGSLILVTNKWMRLPAEVGGKPLHVISLAHAGL